eukprot:687545-Lingulodinium_polyedra.AAC.1
MLSASAGSHSCPGGPSPAGSASAVCTSLVAPGAPPPGARALRAPPGSQADLSVLLEVSSG